MKWVLIILVFALSFFAGMAYLASKVKFRG